MNQLVAAVEDGRPLAGGAGYVEAMVFRVNQLVVALGEHHAPPGGGAVPAAPGGPGAPGGHKQGPPVDSLQAIDVEEGDDGGRDVDVLRQRVDARPWRDASRETDDE